jgi:hypothetical protein
MVAILHSLEFGYIFICIQMLSIVKLDSKSTFTTMIFLVLDLNNIIQGTFGNHLPHFLKVLTCFFFSERKAKVAKQKKK